MNGVTYDTGALIAADRNDRRMWALHAGFLALEVSPTVPTPVLAEAWRGGSRQASLARFLALCITEPLTDEQAKAVGVLARASGHDDIVDVTVVEGASAGTTPSSPRTRLTSARSPMPSGPAHDRDRLTEVRRDARGSQRRPFGGAKRRIGSSLIRFSGRGTRGRRARTGRGTGRCRRGRSRGT